jgi:hypothetical protein
MPASPGSASVLPGDIADDRVHICTRSQLRLTLGSLNRLPGVFHIFWWPEITALRSIFERAASAIILYVLYIYTIRNIFHCL